MGPVEIQGKSGAALLTGAVDRVDLLHTPQGDYVRVVDYKTGHRDFDYTDLLNRPGPADAAVSLRPGGKRRPGVWRPGEAGGRSVFSRPVQSADAAPAAVAGCAGRHARQPRTCAARACSWMTRRCCRPWSPPRARPGTCPTASEKRRAQRRSGQPRAAGAAAAACAPPAGRDDRRALSLGRSPPTPTAAAPPAPAPIAITPRSATRTRPSSAACRRRARRNSGRAWQRRRKNMAKFELTPQQRQAVEETGGALLVSAAAGSGKTKVLVDRLLRQVTKPGDACNVDDFLIITYTRAAAGELRGKIAAALQERLAESPDDLHLQRQLHRVYLARDLDGPRLLRPAAAAVCRPDAAAGGFPRRRGERLRPAAGADPGAGPGGGVCRTGARTGRPILSRYPGGGPIRCPGRRPDRPAV